VRERIGIRRAVRGLAMATAVASALVFCATEGRAAAEDAPEGQDPAAYRIVHIAAPRITDGEAGAADRERLARVLAALGAPAPDGPTPEQSEEPSGTETGAMSEAEQAAADDNDDGEDEDAPRELPFGLAVITGPLTQHGAAEEFAALRRVIDDSPVPVHVAPGPEDMRTGLYAASFGRSPKVARFGADGYLLFDTSDVLPVEDISEQAGALQQMRRSIAGVRWAFGAAHAYSLRMGMRAQMALFIDTPLDVLLVSETDVRDETGAPAMPWGQTLVVETPAFARGVVRIIEVYPYGIVPREAAAL